jgi:tetratricopeptide (TPR) repeat protein
VNKNTKIINFILSAIIIIFFYIPSFADSKQDDFINKQKRFINELYNNKRYFDCIAETQRLLEYKKNIADQKALLYFIDACYFSGGQYKTVISRLQNINNITKDKQELPILFLLSNSYLNIGYYNLSKEILYKLNYSDVSISGRSDLFAKRVGILFKNFEYQNILSEIDNADKYFVDFNKLFSLPQFKEDIESYREIGLKSKWLSVSFSALLPGAGQIYSGRVVDGLLSLAVITGSVFGACYFYNKKDKPMTMTFTFFSCLFYSGNLYGAYNSAEDANRKLNEGFRNSINKKYNLGYNPADYIDIGIFE